MEAQNNMFEFRTVLNNHVPDSGRQLYPQYGENWLHKYLHIGVPPSPFQNVEKATILAEE